MNILGPTRYARLNEATVIVFLTAGLFVLLSLASYTYLDPSWDTAAGSVRAHNLTGRFGAHLADFLFQSIGLTAYALPVLILLLGWRWLRSTPIQAPVIKIIGSAMFIGSISTGLALLPDWRPFNGVIPPGGLAGLVLADYLTANMNVTGAALFTSAVGLLSLYLISTFSMSKLSVWLAGPIAWLRRAWERFGVWRAERTRIAAEKARPRACSSRMSRSDRARAGRRLM
jgi:DNA segregation ATPase FtsK/SpoIIIE, S-DNA-T family